jgi:phospholipid/cholesterol/gamma-HCH transport system substrate-binding protein
VTSRVESEIKVGIFVTVGTILGCIGILMLGGNSSLFSRSVAFSVVLPQSDGLFEGAKVVLGGVNVGTIKTVDLDETGREIRATLNVNRRYKDFIRQGTEAEVLTQGMLGDKYISLSVLTNDAPSLEPGSTIPAKPTKNLAEFLSRGDQLMLSLNSIAGSLDRLLKSLETENSRSNLFRSLGQSAKNMSEMSSKLSQEVSGLNLKGASKNLNAIIEKINSGQGTLGALVNDPALYDEVRALMGGANRNRIVRNLVRQTVKDGEKNAPEPSPKK